MSPVAGIAVVAAAAAVLMAAIAIAERTAGLPSEVLRKLVHLVTGTLSLSFPWLFHDRWPVLVLAGITAAGMLALRLVPGWLAWVQRAGFGRSLRLESLGDVTFPIAIAGLFLLTTGQPLFYVIPVAVATYADAAAAVAGKRFGRHKFSAPFGGTKSVEGSVACGATALACFGIPLGVTGHCPPVTAAILSVGGAFLSAALEAVSWSGLDNLFLPLGAWLYLKLLLP